MEKSSDMKNAGRGKLEKEIYFNLMDIIFHNIVSFCGHK